MVLAPSINSSTLDSIAAGGYTLISYDTKGDFRWGTGVQYAYIGRGTAITLDNQGHIYTTGYVADNQPTTGDFISTDDSVKITLPVKSGSIFIAKYDDFGHLIWASLESGLTSSNAAVENYPNSIAVDRNQNVYVTGDLTRFNLAGGYYIATDSLHTNGRDAFVAKFSSSACLQPDSITISPPAGPLCVATMVDIAFNLSFPTSINTGNLYRLELSDSSGSFANPQILGSVNSSNYVDTISFIVPPVADGRYFIRIVSTNPAIIGNEVPVYFYTPFAYSSTL